jgi:hypothetical protein
MKLKFLAIAAIAAMTAGTAMAQDANMTDKLMDTAAMFFTDKEMTVMKSADEMKAAWASMSAEDQKMLKDGCTSGTSIKNKEFCDIIGTM